MDDAAQARLNDNIVGVTREVPCEIQVRKIGHFHKADPAYGEASPGALASTWSRPAKLLRD
jgi:catalase